MLIGRTLETAAIDRLLAAAREGLGGALVLRGEAGAGKSALLEYARSLADGMTVLRGVGVELESELAYAALHQILRPAFERIGQLPEPQAAALRSAFALTDETVDERFRVSLGALGLLSEVAEERPLLCLVDDVQWFDKASADAILFAARRLDAEPVAVLFAARQDPAHPFVAADIPALSIPALDATDARALVTERLGDSIAAEVVDWLVESASGNPLALVELPAVLSAAQPSGDVSLTGALPPTTSVEQAYLERVRGLPASVRDLLLVAAAEETGERDAIMRASVELGLDAAELTVAEQYGLVHVERGRVEFRHPLVRSAIYRGAGFVDRERAHRALAACTNDVDRRAWHRASATVGTDDEVADELERSAGRARLRSGHAAAAAALERAAELTADTDKQAQRLVRAAWEAWRAGRSDHATALLAQAGPHVDDPHLQADVDHLRGIVELRRGVLIDAADIFLAGAAAIESLDPRKALEMLLEAREAAGWAGDTPRTVAVRLRATALPPSDDPKARFLVDLLDCVGRLYEGETTTVTPLVHDVLDRADGLDEPRWLVWSATLATAIGDEARESSLMRRAISLARASGAVDTLTNVLLVYATMGLLVALDAEASEGLALARETDQPTAASTHLSMLAWSAAVHGKEERCQALAAEALALAPLGVPARTIADWGVGILDLSRGRSDEAATRLGPVVRAGHPYFAVMAIPDLVEALASTDRLELAEETAAAFIEGFAQPGSPGWALALAARCRALLSSREDADAAFADAVRLHGESERPFDRARTELLYGEFLRRERRRTAAREHLRVALDLFERLGAEIWSERARGELRATGETSRKRDPSTVTQLTPQELQIARLVAEGVSNKEAAAQLFISPRTVEYHLRKVFAKLGIASRAELIRSGVGSREEALAALS